jgi:predicted DNA-binding protein with PD1-like motif
MKYLLLLFTLSLSIYNQAQQVSDSKVHIVRLHPNEDVRLKLSEFVRNSHLQAGYIISCIGTLKQAAVRLANHNETKIWKENFELIALTGTLAPDGNHLHITIADKDGNAKGGHIADGCIVDTSVEIIIGEATDLIFKRETDTETTYKELNVYPKEKK